jgi:isopenicillin-N N-acyltransferase-like protein
MPCANLYRCIAVVITLGLLCSGGALVAAQAYTSAELTQRQTFGKGWLEYRSGQRVLFLQGTPYEMGLQHGALLKNELQQIAKLIDSEPTSKSVTNMILRFFSDLYHRTVVISKALRELPKQYHEEMRGIATGAGLDLETVLLMQYYYEGLGPRGVSIVKFLDDSAQDQVLHGYNLEATWPGLLSDQLTVIVYKPHDGQGFVSIGWPGLVGVVQGMNQSGLSLSYSAMITSEDPMPPSISGLILTREALQHATYVDEVYATFASWPRSGSAIITATATQDEGNALIVEYNAQRIAQRIATSKHVTATSVFTSPALLPFSRIGNVVPETRPQRVDELLQTTTVRTPIDFATLLRDKYDEATGVESVYNYGISNMDVVASTIYDPKQQVFWVARANVAAPASYQQYQVFDLNGEILGKPKSVSTSLPADHVLTGAQGEALALFRQAHALSVTNNEQVDWQQVALLLEKVVAIDPAALPLYRLSEAYRKLGRYDMAQQALLSMLELQETHPYWRKCGLLDLGMIYERLHAYTLARATYQQALEVQIPAGPFLYEQSVLNERISEQISELSIELRSQ